MKKASRESQWANGIASKASRGVGDTASFGWFADFDSLIWHHVESGNGCKILGIDGS